MEQPIIIFDIPEVWEADVPQEFTITIIPNGYEGQIVNIISGFAEPEKVKKLEYYEVDGCGVCSKGKWVEIPVDGGFGPSYSFPLKEMRARFRATLSEAGNIEVYLSVLDAYTGVEIAGSEVKIDASGTDYMEIYEQFLSAVTDEHYAQLSEEELRLELLPLLKRAIYYLCRIAKVPGYNLHNRDDENYMFAQKLGDHEIECLAWAMVVSWVEQQMNSSRLIQQQYYDAGIKTYSPNETMRNLLTLHDDYYRRLKNRLTSYGYKTVDISQFGGNE